MVQSCDVFFFIVFCYVGIGDCLFGIALEC